MNFNCRNVVFSQKCIIPVKYNSVILYSGPFIAFLSWIKQNYATDINFNCTWFLSLTSTAHFVFTPRLYISYFWLSNSITISPIFLIVQLQVKLSSKERRITGLKEEVTTLKLRLNEEEQRVASLRSQRVSIEEELETVLEVITHLSPHSERSVGAWRSISKSNNLDMLNCYR